jgi:hypothetical protein
LAQIGCLDNIEYLEALLGQLDPPLMEATEKLIEAMQNAIKTRVPHSESQQLVSTIDGNLIEVRQLFA